MAEAIKAIQVNQEIESAHQWIDDDGKRGSFVLHALEGQVVTAELLELQGVGDVQRLFRKIVGLEYAEAFLPEA